MDSDDEMSDNSNHSLGLDGHSTDDDLDEEYFTDSHLSDGSSGESSSDEDDGAANVVPNPWMRTYAPEAEDDQPAHQFDQTPGPKDAPPPTANPINYLLLFLTEVFIDNVVTHTNNYARNFLNKNRDTLKPHSYARKWKRTNAVEIKAFFAIIINMGLIRKPTLYSYWTTVKVSSSQLTPWFGRVMSRNRFEILLRFFSLVRPNLPRPNQPGYDPCAHFQPIIEQFNIQSRRHFVPQQNLCVDESLVGTKNKTRLLLYMHHHKWGIKLWVLCESATAYVLACFVYCGKAERPDPNDQRGLAHRVVVKLLEMGNYLRKGHHIFTDNFFTSMALAKELWNMHTYLTGTVRQNSRGLPRAIKTKLRPTEYSFFRQAEHLVTSYREKPSQKKNVNSIVLVKSQRRTGHDNCFKRRTH